MASETLETRQDVENLFSPRFKSVAAMAGWDEEALIIASLVVEDTPERSSSKHKRRSDLIFKSPPSSSSSRRKRRAKKSPVPIPVVNLDEEVIENEENKKKSAETKAEAQEEKRTGVGGQPTEKHSGVSGSIAVLPCIDKLREELSCAICLEICFEPSTTACGHSFCKKCLRSAADKCGKKCPKCRQLISNGRSCTVNTVLWNTIQLLFPQEVETRRTAAAAATNPRNTGREETHTWGKNPRNPIATHSNRSERDDLSRLIVEERSERRRRGVRPSQDRDAALALTLQRQEFMEAFGDSSISRTTTMPTSTTTASLSLARANLRAMASRAAQIELRRRGQ